MNLKSLLVVAVVGIAAVSVAQGGGGRGGQRQRMGGNSLISLLRRAEVQTELKLTDDQKTKLNLNGGPGAGGAGAGGNRGQGGGGQGGGGGQFDAAAFAKAQAEAEAKALENLNADQVKRLKELYVQRVGNRALTRADVQKELGFTEDQTKKIADLQAKQMAAGQALREKMQNGELDREQMMDETTKNNKIMDEELGKVLTPDQATKFKAMRGADFKFEADAPRGGGN